MTGWRCWLLCMYWHHSGFAHTHNVMWFIVSEWRAMTIKAQRGFLFLLGLYDLVCFKTFVTRSAFVLFFLSSIFQALFFLSLYSGVFHCYCRMHELTWSCFCTRHWWSHFTKIFMLVCAGQGQSEDSWMCWLLGKLSFVCHWLHWVLLRLNTLCCGCGISVGPSQMFCSEED